MTDPTTLRNAGDIARELWWPHHESNTRCIALAELDAGSVGQVTLEYADIEAMVRAVLLAIREPSAAMLHIAANKTTFNTETEMVDPIGEYVAAVAWQAMIDSLLEHLAPTNIAEGKW